MYFLSERTELQLSVPVSEMSMWLVFLVIRQNVMQSHQTTEFWVLCKKKKKKWINPVSFKKNKKP